MKFDEFKNEAIDNLIKKHNLSEQQIDEVLPAIGMAIKAVAKGIGAKSAQAGAQAAKKVGAAAVQGAQGAGKGLASKIATKNANTLKKSILKKGMKLPIPDAKGNAQSFKIDDVKGDEVTLSNPKPLPGEPIKTVHKQKALDPIIQGLVK
ncbi:MAG: hypothetical protein ACKVJK_07025 [Methylophagaceae bacterium]|jgi:hypothetical protein|tara:strand:+ start:2066 stop:2515 length:450 start_codon:yes stop_codon:yes gene_type:complete